jgi:hypothetical protein
MDVTCVTDAMIPHELGIKLDCDEEPGRGQDLSLRLYSGRAFCLQIM